MTTLLEARNVTKTFTGGVGATHGARWRCAT